MERWPKRGGSVGRMGEEVSGKMAKERRECWTDGSGSKWNDGPRQRSILNGFWEGGGSNSKDGERWG